MSVNPRGPVTPQKIAEAAKQFGSPFYLYDEQTISDRCAAISQMPNAYGLHVAYAMKANANCALLRLITSRGLDLDCSTLNEVRRAHLAGIPYDKMMLTSQEVPENKDREDLEAMILKGLAYNVCSIRQLEMITDFAVRNKLSLSMRVNPGKGTGESRSRNTGDNYSSFGIHLTHMDKVTQWIRKHKLHIRQVHTHIGSGGDPLAWRENINRLLEIIEQYFPDAETANLGGGFKVARMPDEEPADINDLGHYAKDKFQAFYERTGRKLLMGIEPGTFIMANAGYLVSQVMDKKYSGPDGFEFIILNAGMESNSRPLLYGSRHPYYVISQKGQLLYSDFALHDTDNENDLRVICGRCCESGDSQSIDIYGHVTPRMLVDPELDDYFVIGGTGAYCSAMSLINYNSNLQIPEVILKKDGSFQLIRRRQSMEQMIQNEMDVEE